jgi:transposase
MQPTSSEKREQIIAAKQRGEKTETIILWTKVSKSTIDKVWKRFRDTGSGMATPYTGRKTSITPEIEARIREEVNANSDITLAELVEKLSLPIGISRLSQLLISWGYSFKKRRFIRLHNNVKTFKGSAKNGAKRNPHSTRSA